MKKLCSVLLMLGGLLFVGSCSQVDEATTEQNAATQNQEHPQVDDPNITISAPPPENALPPSHDATP